VALKPSPIQAFAMGGIHALAAVAVIVSLDGPAMSLVLLGVALSASRSVAIPMLWLEGAIAGFEIMPDGSGRWTDCRGEWHSASRIKVSWCGARLVVIGFWRQGASWRWLILAPDAASPDALRTLRVWARWRPD
jgi:hypothetical protein